MASELEIYRQALERIRNRWEREDERAGHNGFDERRSPLAWAMWADADEAIREGGKRG